VYLEFFCIFLEFICISKIICILRQRWCRLQV